MNPIDDTQSNRHKAHDDVEFLANSWNRFEVLDAVAESPRTRTELKELTNVSRVTLSRVLSDLEDRGWIVRETDRFEATNNGAVVAAAVSRLLDRLKRPTRSVRRSNGSRFTSSISISTTFVA